MDFNLDNLDKKKKTKGPAFKPTLSSRSKNAMPSNDVASSLQAKVQCTDSQAVATTNEGAQLQENLGDVNAVPAAEAPGNAFLSSSQSMVRTRVVQNVVAHSLPLSPKDSRPATSSVIMTLKHQGTDSTSEKPTTGYSGNDYLRVPSASIPAQHDQPTSTSCSEINASIDKLQNKQPSALIIGSPSELMMPSLVSESQAVPQSEAAENQNLPSHDRQKGANPSEPDQCGSSIPLVDPGDTKGEKHLIKTTTALTSSKGAKPGKPSNKAMTLPQPTKPAAAAGNLSTLLSNVGAPDLTDQELLLGVTREAHQEAAPSGQHVAVEAWQSLLGTLLDCTARDVGVPSLLTAAGRPRRNVRAASKKIHESIGELQDGQSLLQLVVHAEEGGQGRRMSRRAGATPRSRSETPSIAEGGYEGAEDGRRPAKSPRPLTINEQLSLAGLGVVRLPKVSPDEPVDRETWSLRRIIARSEAWDKQKRQEERQQALEEKSSEAGAAAATASVVPVASQMAPPSSRGASAAPRLQVVNGQIVVDSSSLTVQAQRSDDVALYTRVEEDTKLINSQSYMKRGRGERWGEEDTDLFYNGLRHFGTDFTLISQLFPDRDRKHIKNKFNKEQKSNLTKVNDALRGKGRNSEDTRQLSELMKSNIRLQQQQQQQGVEDQGTVEEGNVQKLNADAVEDACESLKEPVPTVQEVDPFEEGYY
ncbi:hypothetical protein CEUSTIGMA_g12002.t1 [Chlamydomonas eustigma]|uniref:Myb-like domain-containing protein n=1 Tax=Chlamydomonas eustigma TaxID=1157962 RepID=A0A250XNB9_9CHLO|nr:hypothetical protein CEUSTIGMA_g12002.t1 [Chlamydomonas eustigma]|eukprot:GAX84581.1 hypothetical protein CEUSTIGMA_g12002.t1 [Chlamydomonas eustigma]